jgi:hypothetical protein
MSCNAFTIAVEAHFLKRRFGIDSCSSDLDMDIFDAKNQIERWISLGGPFKEVPVITNPSYTAAPEEIRYCLPA